MGVLFVLNETERPGNLAVDETSTSVNRRLGRPL